MLRKVAIKKIYGLKKDGKNAEVGDLVEVTEEQAQSIGKERLVEPTADDAAHKPAESEPAPTSPARSEPTRSHQGR